MAASRLRVARPGRRFLRGLTLVELVLVACILAILSSIAVPRVAGTLHRHRAEAAADRIAGDLALAQRQARLSSAAQRVAFDTAGHRYRLVGLADPDRPAAEYEVNLAAEPYGVRIISADFGGGAVVTFDGYGQPDHGGTVVVAAGGYTASVRVDAESGRARRQ